MENNRSPFLYKASFVHHFKAMGEFKLELQSGNAQFGSKSEIFFVPCDLEIWRMTLKNNRAPLLYYAYMFSFVHHIRTIGEFKLELRSGNAQFGLKDGNFLSPVTLKFDIWPWKTIGHLFYTTWSSVHHFIATGDFKLDLQSGNTQFGTKSAIFESRDLGIWQMALKNNREPLLSKWGFDLYDLDLWPLNLTFAWTSLMSME